VYELMCDTMWRAAPVDPPDWFRAYVAARYGAAPGLVGPVADALASAFYTKNEQGDGAPRYQNRPGLKTVTQASSSAGKFRDTLSLMLALPAEVQKQPLFQRDLVDVAKRLVAEEVDGRIVACIAAARRHDAAASVGAKARFNDLMLDLDALLDTVPQYRLSGWIADARHRSGDGDSLERNARMQVTVWGGKELHDYAAKEWSGLVGDFYLMRWDRFFDALGGPGYDDDAFRKASAEWELEWCSRTTLPRVRHVDPVEQARKLLADTE